MSDAAGLLRIEGLQVRYGAVRAVAGVDLTVAPAEIVAIVGPNGAGKTSLLSAVAGLVRPDAGSVRIGDTVVADIGVWDVVRHGVALVPEGRNIFGSLTVLENLRLGATPRRDEGVPGDIEAMFATFPILGERRRQPAGQLSGGEQQMLAIARAMLSKPALLLLDEPSLGLAPTMVERIYEQLAAIRAAGVAIVLVEQNAARAFSLADRAVVMSHGRFTLAGAPTDVAADPAFDKAYFGIALAGEGRAG
ncbi:MAG TPA: ABC transporter ATP-binding protein [Methylomirabilota bacterium]|nr:ABC transporter ATP-binding protein [Methylomirabilota bacterium]